MPRLLAVAGSMYICLVNPIFSINLGGINQVILPYLSISCNASYATSYQTPPGSHVSYPSPITREYIKKEEYGGLPTYQDHRPVLHVFQLANSGMLRLFPLHCHANDIKQLLRIWRQ